MARKDKPYMPLYIQDFLTDEKLMECSASSTGVYIRLMCIMHKSPVYGTILLKQKDKQTDKQVENFALKVAKHLPFPLPVIISGLDELISEDVLQLNGDILIQKRMFEDGKLSETRSESGTLGGISTQEKTKNFALAKHQANSDIDIDIENDTEINNEGVVGIRKKPSNSGVKRVLPPRQIKDPFSGKLKKWTDWKTYKRKEHRFSYKSSESENQALKNLHELSGGNISVAGKIIEQSIGNGWQGLFKLKNQSNGQYPKKKDGSGGFDSGITDSNVYDEMK